jgi:hypothetical protein
MDDERYKTGDRAGDPKHISSFTEAGRNALDVGSKIFGIPYSGPFYEWAFPVERQLAVQREYRKTMAYKAPRMSTYELKKAYRGTVYQTSGKRQDGTRWVKGRIKPDRQDDHDLLYDELLRRGVSPGSIR